MGDGPASNYYLRSGETDRLTVGDRELLVNCKVLPGAKGSDDDVDVTLDPGESRTLTSTDGSRSIKVHCENSPLSSGGTGDVYLRNNPVHAPVEE